MPLSLQPPNREVDVDFLVFIERYATDLLKWDILTFFAQNPESSPTATEVAQQIGRNAYSVRPELGDLVLTGVLEHTPTSNGHIKYQLTTEPALRRLILKFAHQLAE